MDEQTLKALNGSIEKWQKIVDGVGQDHGSSNCPLCKLFNSPIEDERRIAMSYYGEDCWGCPVMDATSKHYCGGSPYKDWQAVGPKARWDLSGGVKSLDAERARRAAQAELDFLKSLLPKT
jgi:hypothetical protein